MNLTIDEQTKLWELRNKIAHNQGTSSDMGQFLELILKSSQDNYYEVENYIRSIGFSTINDFQKALEQKNRNELIAALLIIGGAVLLGLALSRRRY